jgi:hypothetical protein
VIISRDDVMYLGMGKAKRGRENAEAMRRVGEADAQKVRHDDDDDDDAVVCMMMMMMRMMVMMMMMMMMMMAVMADTLLCNAFQPSDVIAASC